MAKRSDELPDEVVRWTDDERRRAEQVLDGHVTVVNVRKSGPHKHLVPWLVSHGLVHYVGKAGQRHSWPGSDFANPFVAEAKSDRDKMVRDYEEWLDEQPELVRRIKEGELNNRALGCWCAPEPCHADVLAQRAEQSGSRK